MGNLRERVQSEHGAMAVPCNLHKAPGRPAGFIAHYGKEGLKVQPFLHLALHTAKVLPIP